MLDDSCITDYYSRKGMEEDGELTNKTVTAADIGSYAQQLSRSVSRIMQTGKCSENDLSFRNTYVAGYEHTPEVAE